MFKEEPMHKKLQESIKLIELFEQRNQILRVIGEASTNYQGEKTRDEILEQCCRILVENNDFCLVWAGKREIDEKEITPIAAVNSIRIADRDCMNLIEQVVLEMHSSNPAAIALKTGEPVIIQDVFEQENMNALQQVASTTGFRSCSSWPLRYKEYEYGVLCIHSEDTACFDEVEIDFLSNIITDISLALYSLETTIRLQVERDFNREIVDTVQALMVSIAPCGQILTFNAEAERITGYTQKEVKGRYWVDILLSPQHRKKQQQQMSEALKGEGQGVNFQASLQTKDGQEHIINWHSSIRSEGIGKVGLVLFGHDITEQLQADHALGQALDQLRNIFSVIQDPALIVSRDNIIMDANLATFAAARKTREQVIGRKVCEILHGGRRDKTVCPLETLVSSGKSRILETELRGLHGQYMLTISPLSTGDDQAALLVARDLTEEELLQAEAIRAAQLASIGELAAGVAHEINNPVNGIINYAQLLLDEKEANNPDSDLLQRIIKEGRRVGVIAHKLLDFARQGEEEVEAVAFSAIVDDCISLIGHQLKRDGIILENSLADNLPQILCNSQQIQQVLLNILSNARYALNKRYVQADPDKKIILSAEGIIRGTTDYVALVVKDHGTGIEHDIMDRLTDPFFSTKPKGEGTGLGLSISYGLIKENKGFMQISSRLGHSTTLTVALPAA
jgi:PAS domain S-box-containing protein